MMKDQLLSCDWGTSSFRLRLVDTVSGQVLGERLSPVGVAATFDAWKAEQNRKPVDRGTFFCRFLEKQIDGLATALSRHLNGIPVALSGMASSSIGLAELPYAPLPFALNGGQVSVRWIDPLPDFAHRLLLISGVSSQRDVMRGEETQLIGLGDQLPKNDPCVLIFPGTHSKHMYVRKGQLVDFQTFMTGELYSVLIRHTILKESTEDADLGQWLEQEPEPFRQGVLASESGNLLGSLFSVRTNQLFRRFDRYQNALYLSGLLIGSELRPLHQKHDWQIILCCDNNLVDFYEMAIAQLGLADRTLKIAAEQIRHSAIAGHLKIMDHQLALADPVK